MENSEIEEYIVLDSAGFNARPRYTHYPSGDAVLRQPWMSEGDWDTAKEKFFSEHKGIIRIGN